MKAQHTPGPWAWHHHEGQFVKSEFSSLVAENGDIVIDDGSASGAQCQIIDPFGADARLIASAPELLEALQDMLILYSGISHDPDETLRCARAAIVKATVISA